MLLDKETLWETVNASILVSWQFVVAYAKCVHLVNCCQLSKPTTATTVTTHAFVICMQFEYCFFDT